MLRMHDAVDQELMQAAQLLKSRMHQVQTKIDHDQVMAEGCLHGCAITASIA